MAPWAPLRGNGKGKLAACSPQMLSSLKIPGGATLRRNQRDMNESLGKIAKCTSEYKRQVRAEIRKRNKPQPYARHRKSWKDPTHLQRGLEGSWLTPTHLSIIYSGGLADFTENSSNSCHQYKMKCFFGFLANPCGSGAYQVPTLPPPPPGMN